LPPYTAEDPDSHTERGREGKGHGEICTTNWVALTTDLWSSLTCTSFMAVTAHYILGEEGCKLQTKVLDCSRFHGRHTGESIKERLLSVISDFNATEKIVCIVSENGANVKKAISDSGITGLACYAHTLNLCVTGTLKQMVEFEVLRKKISDMVTFLHRSNIGKEEFEGVQFCLGVPVIKSLIADVKTWWNSVFLMIDRFLELKDAVILFQTMESGKNYSFTQQEWQLALDFKFLLQPAFEATVEMSGERYVSSSKVIPITKSLLSFYALTSRQQERDNPTGFKKKFADAMTERLDLLSCGPR
jgi:hypothetical protein